MLRRDLLSMMALAAVGGFVLPAWLLAEAEKLEVTKTDEEWRRLLTPAQYQVLRHEDTEPAFSSPFLTSIARGSSPAPAASFRCSSRRPSSRAGPGGRAFGVRSMARWALNSIGVF
jgi:peptide-methionine (R)-S-oxide reductase